MESSPWPLLSSLSLMGLVLNFLCYMKLSEGLLLSGISALSLAMVMFLWWRDVVRESTFQGFHTLEVVSGLYLGVILFIASEVMFFFSFFFSLFFISLSPSVEGGGWPPAGVIPLPYLGAPLLNTLLLLSSGVSVTWSHHAILSSNLWGAQLGLSLTVFLGLLFTASQVYEYVEIPFTLADSVFGSLFFVITGFHGLHVLVGNVLLLTSLLRLFQGHFSREHHLGFEASAWYWHFVDVVWLGLYISLYWWVGV